MDREMCHPWCIVYLWHSPYCVPVYRTQDGAYFVHSFQRLFPDYLDRRMWRYALHPFLVYIGKTAVEVERIGTEMLFKLIWETTYNRILQKKSDLIWIGI